MRQISKLESGNTYTLSQIFSNDFIIAIPDLQRDYCWGLETYDNKGRQQGELVSGFLTSLKNKCEELQNTNSYTPMGLIYGYEWPKGTYQLCDGQQRITTFYLLAGELYKSNLVSDNETKTELLDILKNTSTNSDSIIRTSLQYSIRETTLYFLSDLVEHYFLSDQCDLVFNTLEEREKSHLVLNPLGRPAWYFMEYDNDPTIQSILAAIYSIRKFLKESLNDSNISSFAKAIAHQFSFIYYDMGNRLRGEETFVILNTTGEPLTSTENLKPILIANLSDEDAEISKQWEDREDWFWKHKSSKELTSDDLSQDFYTWWIMTHYNKESVDLIKDYRSLPNLNASIIDIHKFFDALVTIIRWIAASDDAKLILKKVSEWTEEKIDDSNENNLLSWLRAPSHYEIFLPLLLFYEKFGNNHLLTFLRCLTKNYYIGKTTKGENHPDGYRPYIRLQELFRMIQDAKTADDDILKHPTWYNRDEHTKEQIFMNNEKELLQLELDDLLRFDFNIIWDSGASTIEMVKSRKERLYILHQLAQGNLSQHIGYETLEQRTMSNQYRVLKFLLKWGAPTGKQRHVNWKQWCMWLNRDEYIQNLSTSYLDEKMCELLNTNNLKERLDSMLKETIISLNNSEGIFSETSLSHPEGIMRAWLISKMLVNENHNIDKQPITSYDGHSLCVNKENQEQNLINPSLPVSIGNICLHHVNKNGHWTVNEHNYPNPKLLDTPLYTGIIDIEYDDFKSGCVSKDAIDSTTSYIISLFESYISER